MSKKQKKIQIILISIGMILIFATYFYYPYMKEFGIKEETSVRTELDKNTDNDNKDSTLFKNVEYKGFYDLNKPFTIKSEEAHMLNEEPDILYMTNMNVILYLNDGRIVNIKSDQGKYNKITYDCFFEKNVVATDGETKISAENLDLLAEENAVKIYNNVYLNNIEGSIRADYVDYDFETKYFKVSMFDNQSVQMKIIK